MSSKADLAVKSPKKPPEFELRKLSQYWNSLYSIGSGFFIINL